MLKRTLMWMASVVGAMLVMVSGATAAEMPATPTLITPAQGAYTESQSPWITGLAPADTRVAVYIDDVFNGYATVVGTSEETLSFAYKPFLPLEYGEHTVNVRAEDVEAGTRSTLSKTHRVVVEHTLPAPTVLGRVIDADSSWKQPWIVGVAPAGTTVEIWVDDVFNGYATVTADESGTGHFAYKPFLPLSNGKHIVEARTRAERADESVRYSAVSEENTLWIVDPATVEEDTKQTTSTADSSVEVETTESNDSAESESTEQNSDQNVEEENTTSEESTESEDSEENVEGASENAESTESKDSEEHSDEAEEADKKEDKKDEAQASTTRTVVGWLLLLIAAIIVARQIGMRRRQQSSATTNTTPLDIATNDNNSNIEVISPAKGSDSSSESSSSDSSSSDNSSDSSN